MDSEQTKLPLLNYPTRKETEDYYWQILQRQKASSVCRRTLASYITDTSAYILKMIDTNYIIKSEAKTITAETQKENDELGADIKLLILAYLTNTKENVPSGKWISPREVAGGDLFFSAKAHIMISPELLRALKTSNEFSNAGNKIGAKKQFLGDASFVIQTLPKIPLLFIYWEGDNELPSRISVFVDQNVLQNLAIDGVWLAIKMTEKSLLTSVSTQ